MKGISLNFHTHALQSMPFQFLKDKKPRKFENSRVSEEQEEKPVCASPSGNKFENLPMDQGTFAAMRLI